MSLLTTLVEYYYINEYKFMELKENLFHGNEREIFDFDFMVNAWLF